MLKIDKIRIVQIYLELDGNVEFVHSQYSCNLVSGKIINNSDQ